MPWCWRVGSSSGNCSEYSGVAGFGASAVIVEANVCTGCNKDHYHTQARVCTPATGPNTTVPDEFRVAMNSGEWTYKV